MKSVLYEYNVVLVLNAQSGRRIPGLCACLLQRRGTVWDCSLCPSPLRACCRLFWRTALSQVYDCKRPESSPQICVFLPFLGKPDEPSHIALSFCVYVVVAGELFLPLDRPWCWKMYISHFCSNSPKGASFFLLLDDYRNLIKRASEVKQEDASL